MPIKITLNENSNIQADRVKVTPGIEHDVGGAASANTLMPTEIEIEREVTPGSGPECFEAAIAAPESANETTFGCEMAILRGTAYTVNVEEGTVVEWSVEQSAPNARVIETAKMLARAATISTQGKSVKLTAVADD